MDKTLAKNWAKALESGRFKQVNGTLRDKRIINKHKSFSYCCLGVLCVVAKKFPKFKQYRTVLDTALEVDADLSFFADKNETKMFSQIVGMPNREEKQFISYNDDMNLSFEGIAKKVRQRYKLGKKPKTKGK